MTTEQDERLAEQAERVGQAEVVRLIELIAAALRALDGRRGRPHPARARPREGRDPGARAVRQGPPGPDRPPRVTPGPARGPHPGPAPDGRGQRDDADLASAPAQAAPPQPAPAASRRRRQAAPTQARAHAAPTEAAPPPAAPSRAHAGRRPATAEPSQGPMHAARR